MYGDMWGTSRRDNEIRVEYLHRHIMSSLFSNMVHRGSSVCKDTRYAGRFTKECLHSMWDCSIRQGESTGSHIYIWDIPTEGCNNSRYIQRWWVSNQLRRVPLTHRDRGANMVCSRKPGQWPARRIDEVKRRGPLMYGGIVRLDFERNKRSLGDAMRLYIDCSEIRAPRLMWEHSDAMMRDNHVLVERYVERECYFYEISLLVELGGE